MPLNKSEKIWHNGHFIELEGCHDPRPLPCCSYGSSVFEGIRCYSTPSGPAVFRVRANTFAA